MSPSRGGPVAWMTPGGWQTIANLQTTSQPAVHLVLGCFSPAGSHPYSTVLVLVSWCLTYILITISLCISSYHKLEIQTRKENGHFSHHWIFFIIFIAFIVFIASLSFNKRNSRKLWPEIQWVWQASWDWIRTKSCFVKSTTSRQWGKRGGIFRTIWRDTFHKIVICQH